MAKETKPEGKSAVRKTYEKMRDLILNMDADLQKAELNSNKAAGRRARAALQEVKKEAQNLRRGILDLR